MEIEYKEARFDKYCKTCKYEQCPETDETCDYCLDHPINEGTEKPVNYERKENNEKRYQSKRNRLEK